MSILVDTDVFSFIIKQDSRAALYRPHLLGRPKLISFMTLAELRRWALTRNWGTARRRELEMMLEDFGIIYADDELCTVWAQVMSDAHHTGRPIATADAWIAATALLFGIPLATHNRSHFTVVKGLEVVSEAN